MFCKNCGKEIADDSKFCNECGAVIVTEIQSSEDKPEKARNEDRYFLKLCLIICIIVAICVCANKETREGIGNLFESYGISFSLSTGERNALAKAKLYLETMPFSRKGLIAQLEYDGYTISQAQYAVDHCGADWKAQAAKKGKLYLETMPFSRDGLINQLEYDGFTYEQAVYGAKQNGY